MKNMKRMVCLVVMVLFVAGSMAFAAGSAVKGATQDKCPVMGGTIDKNNYVDYQGKRIYFCCTACPDEFKKNPEKYMKKLKDQGVVLEDAPKAQ